MFDVLEAQKRRPAMKKISTMQAFSNEILKEQKLTIGVDLGDRLKLAERGGKNAKKRAVVAVARKLAVLLHRLWVSGEVYEPLRNSQKAMRAAA
jgi:hypothetical protein